MAKPERVFYGSDSFGRSVERAKSVSGAWFSRHQEPSCWGNQMTKWYLDDEPEFETHGLNVYSGERFEYEQPVCFWGFNKMTEIKGELPRYRLPA